MIANNHGFTLLESLLVLSIFLIISSITAFSIKPLYDANVSEQFLTQFQADFLYGQQYAISHQQEINIIIQNDQHYYYMRGNYLQPIIVSRHYSNAINIASLTLPLTFKFTPSGAVSKFGSLLIHCGSKQYTMTVLIGEGRFYVAEE